MANFNRLFWLSALVTAVICFSAAGLFTRVVIGRVAPRPPYPRIGERFVAEYAGVGAYIEQDLYYWNLFGFGDRIKHSDVILLGSSHTQFGLSARELSVRLSHALGHPVSAFNLGMGCGETLNFDIDVLKRLEVSHAFLIADAYTIQNEALTACDEVAMKGDPVQSAFAVAGVWSRFTWDWILDGSLPSISLRDGSLHIERFLNAPVLEVDWDTGDASYFYRPDDGEVFPNAAPTRISKVLSGQPGELPWTLRDGSIALPEELQPLNGPLGSTVVTMIPFPGAPNFGLWNLYEPAYHALVEALASKASYSRVPFLEIDANGLASFDHGHLTGSSRVLATERLGQSLKRFVANGNFERQ